LTVVRDFRTSERRETIKHTPGPWKYEGGGSWVYGKDGVVAQSSLDYAHLEEMRANARLIAAAPEMYAILDEISRTVQASIWEISEGQENKINAVLAKARGESSIIQPPKQCSRNLFRGEEATQMEIVAVKEKSAGNESVGEMWLETGIFDESTPVGDIIKWSQNGRMRYNDGGRLIITVPKTDRY
jgi:hypothetical protein